MWVAPSHPPGFPHLPLPHPNPPVAHLWVLQQDVAKHEAQADLGHLSEIRCAVGQVWPGSQAVKQTAHSLKELQPDIFQAAIIRRGQKPMGKEQGRL